MIILRFVLICFVLLISGLASATTIRWNAGFEGFSVGDVYFASTVQFSNSGLNRNTSLFRYSPALDEVSEVMRLFGTGVVRYLDFDPVSGGLYIADVNRIQLLKPDGQLVDVSDSFSTVLDISVSSSGEVFTSEFLGIRQYTDIDSTQIASVGANLRGLDVKSDGSFIGGIDLAENSYGDNNLLTIDVDGSVIGQSQVSTGGLGLVRLRSDGSVVAVSDQRTTLNLVNPDGTFTPFADRSDGIFQTDGIAIDSEDDVWVTTRGRPASLQEFLVDGTRKTFVSLELSDLVGAGETGFFSPDAVAIIPVPSHTLTVNKSGAGNGTITSNPAAINCGGTCFADYDEGTPVILTAMEEPDSVFSGWSGGGCSGTGDCTVTINADTSVTATFNKKPTLNVIKTGTGEGTITSLSAGINCGADCTEVYEFGTIVVLTATPNAGSSFAGWSGGGCNVAGTCMLTMNASTTLTATFKLQTPGSFTFTDDPLPMPSNDPQFMPPVVKAIHFTELRQAINTLRSQNGLSAFSFTGTLDQRITHIRAVHLAELRTALNGVYDALGRTRPTYTDPTIVGGNTVIKKTHIEEIRTAIRAMETAPTQ